jgi:hypothetical protein
LQEQFQVWEDDEPNGDGAKRYIFLFKSKLMITERIESDDIDEEAEFRHLATIRVSIIQMLRVNICIHTR